jgi:protein involved in polysaccharide export with SLBB domain
VNPKKIHDQIALWVFLICGVSFFFGCASQKPTHYNSPPAPKNVSQFPKYLIQPGDELEIKFFYTPEINETVLVRPDGKISLQLIDEVQAGGLTPAKLDEVLTEKYATELKYPVLTVIVRSFTGQWVYVGGEVGTQGPVEYSDGMTPLEAVINAGGLLETAEPEGVIVIRKGANNEPVPHRVDLKSVLNGTGHGANLQLYAKDVVYVPKSLIAEANKFVKQYIQDLLLFRGVSLGFTYELHDESSFE